MAAFCLIKKNKIQKGNRKADPDPGIKKKIWITVFDDNKSTRLSKKVNDLIIDFTDELIRSPGSFDR